MNPQLSRTLRGRRHARTASFHHVHGQSRKRNQEFLFQGVDLEVIFFWNYRKRGSASYIVREVREERERERERERHTAREPDGSDVTIVALKLAFSLHFLLPKIRTIGDEFTLSLAKYSHFSFLPS